MRDSETGILVDLSVASLTNALNKLQSIAELRKRGVAGPLVASEAVLHIGRKNLEILTFQQKPTIIHMQARWNTAEGFF